MTDKDLLPQELTKEKKLWDIYKSSRRIPFSGFNALTTLIVFILLLTNVCVTNTPIIETLENVRKYSEIGFSIALSTLGYLLAGFTIFTTVSQPELLIEMSKVRNEISGLSYLKHNLFVFLRVFIYYLTFCVYCIAVIIFATNDGLLDKVVSMSPKANEIKVFLVEGAYVILFTGYYFLLMQLKSFIFNIYHAVMTSLRWKAGKN